jgi:hypothetical protein
MYQETGIKSYVSLKEIVYTVKDEQKEYSLRGYTRLLGFAIRGLKELSLQYPKDNIKEISISVNDNGIIPLPKDFLDLIAIAAPIYGVGWTFTKKSEMVSPLGEECGVAANNSDESHDIGDFGDYGAYGIPGGQNHYYFKLERGNNRIVVNGNIPNSSARLIYKATNVSMASETIVPKIYEEFLIAYVKEKDVRGDKKANQYDKESARRDKNDEYEKLITSTLPTLDEWYDAIYSTFYQTAKI